MIDFAWTINEDTIFFYVNTHDPATGAEVDADVVPSFRIYEDDEDTPLGIGDMAKLDDVGTVGFYFASIPLVTVSGFENGKSYAMRVSATVGGVTGAKVFGFMLKDPLANIVEGALTVKDVMRLILSAVALQLEDADTLAPKFKDLAGGKVRIAGTVDGDGNRTAVVLDAAD